MRKLILLLMVINLFAKVDSKYLEYTRKLYDYHFELKDFDKIKSPFEIKAILKTKNGKILPNKIAQNAKLVRSIKFELLSIFNNSAYILIKNYLGDVLVNQEKRWVKKGDIIGDNCKVVLITTQKVVIKCKNKKIVKSLYKEIPGLKEIK